MNRKIPSSTLLSAREIWFHVGGLVLLAAALAGWYRQSTGARAVPGLMQMLQDDDPSTRILAAEQLGLVGPAAAAAVPVLSAQAMCDGNQHAGTTAAAALKSIDLSAARRVMDHFIPRLRDPEVQQRRTAAAVLGSLGPPAKPAVPALLAAVDDTDELVRRNILTSLAGIGLPSAPIRAALIAAFRSPSSLVRQSAVGPFAFTMPVPPEAEAPLRALTAGEDAAVAGLAKSALERPRADDPAHLHALELMLEHRSSREYALSQLAQLGPHAGGSASALLPLLQDESPLIRYLAVEALGAMGPAARDARPQLEQHRETDPVVRAAVAEALAAITGPLAPASKQDRPR